MQRFLLEGFAVDEADGRLETQTEGGPPKSRLRFSSEVGAVSGMIDFQTGGYARFKRFWREETKHGSLPFLIDDQIADRTPLLDASDNPLLTEIGAPLLVSAKWLAKFAGRPKYTALGGTWFKASFGLVIYP